MQRRIFSFITFATAVSVAAIASTLGALPAAAAEPKPLELFGVVLKGAGRDTLRQAFKQNGLSATREANNYWVDTYNANGVLDGATAFQAGYVPATGKFAYDQYTFEAFMDTALVGKVITMVSSKYGRPTSQSGNCGLGQVTARWNMGQGRQIEVSRGWPDITTELTFLDTVVNGQMNLFPAVEVA